MSILENVEHAFVSPICGASCCHRIARPNSDQVRIFDRSVNLLDRVEDLVEGPAGADSARVFEYGTAPLLARVTSLRPS